MPDRFGVYRNILEAALKKGYEHLSLIQFYELVISGKLNEKKKIFIHRHDIDTDAKAASVFFEIEKSLNVKSSYYFRLSTLDISLMKEINSFGGEASYHYEEIASYCKRYRIRKKEQVIQNLPEIKEMFRMNFRSIETRLGYKLQTVASHGDFVNRKLKIANHFLLQQDLRDELNIAAEAYDSVITSHYSVTVSDKPHPVCFSPANPLEVIERDYHIIYLITHPRHWRTNFIVNTKDNLLRFKEGICYNFM